MAQALTELAIENIPVVPPAEPAPQNVTRIDAVPAREPRKPYGVPRRFGLGTIYIGVTSFCILMAAMRAAGGRADFMIFVIGLVSAVAIGQLLLFNADRPRRASALAGVLYIALMLLVNLKLVNYWFFINLGTIFTIFPEFFELFGWHGGEPSLWWGLLYVPLVPIVGVFFGYLGGGIVAGIFLILDYIDRFLRNSAANRQRVRQKRAEAP